MNPASAAPSIGVHDPAAPSALDRRLDQVDQYLVEAEAAIAQLVSQLELVLPYGFGTEAVPQVPMRAVTESSPLAARLDGLAFRGQVVVQRLRSVLDAVDL